ncbi:MAG: hypothetical protein KA210_12095 [Bacteroidia bacterium]|nr:hypothetical protein [Bacteroidia bacterium]
MQIKKSILLLLIFSLGCFSQNKSFIKHNDSLVGNENLTYNKGLIYDNKYKITSQNTSQFLENKYNKGILQYNNEIYYDVSLKYDVFNDLLLFKSNTQIVLETSLITKQVDYFIINNLKFKKIENNSIDAPSNFGYFEEVKINDKIELYIKYKKTLKEDLKSDQISYIFYDYKLYYIYYNMKLQEVTSKKSIINLFPALKKEIKQYYKENRKQREQNIQLFYQNLFKSII